jgi:hypothetical protein
MCIIFANAVEEEAVWRIVMSSSLKLLCLCLTLVVMLSMPTRAEEGCVSVIAVSDEKLALQIAKWTSDLPEVRVLLHERDIQRSTEEIQVLLNQRALAMRSARCFVFSPHDTTLLSAMWRERLAAHGVRLVAFHEPAARTRKPGPETEGGHGVPLSIASVRSREELMVLIGFRQP